MDLHNENQQEQKVEEVTRVIPPVEPPQHEGTTTRRRRTERFAGLTTEEDAHPPYDIGGGKPAPAQIAPVAHKAYDLGEPVAQDTRMSAAVKEAWEAPSHHESSRAVPSQGVPRPSVLDGQRPYRERREKPAQESPTVRRPVQAEGYEPLQQLGSPQPRARRPEADNTVRNEPPRRVRTPETERVGYDNPSAEEKEKTGNRGLIAVIIALLLLAAIILGLLMIPDEDTGVLGSIKRAVTEPVKGLFGGDTEEQASAPTASGFTATISQSTMPYKVVFHMVTSANVTAIRVVDASGEVLPTKITLSTPSSEKDIVWMFEMQLEDGFTGDVQAQMQHGEKWIDTGLWQTISLGGVTPPSVTEGTNANGTPAIVEATPTATPTQTPTVQPTATATPTEAPAVTADVIVLFTPAATTEATVEPTPSVTATPTMSVTATPTMIPTATPVAEATETPTEEPAPQVTEAPSAQPEVTPKLEAVADPSADPALIAETVIYQDGKKVSSYEREKPMNMPAANDYPLRPFGVTTFRGNAFRQNAAEDTVKNPTSLSLAWTVEAGSAAGSSRNYYGIGWTGQPVIVKWATDIRKSMALEDERKEQKNLKEVIVAGMDGKIYFLDLLDGTATREAINFGYPMRATPSMHPLFYPMMTVGQYARKMKSGTSSNIGLYYYNLVDGKQLRMIDGIDRKLKRTYSEDASGAFDTSALIDRTTNTLIAIGTNGLLYTEKLSMNTRMDQETGQMVFAFDDPTEIVTMMSHTKNQKAANVAVESSLAMYGSYAYYADMGGILRCVDTTTMTTAWAVDTGDAVRAAIALDLDADTQTLWLYTANLINNSRTRGDVTIRRYNAMTGAEDWAFAIACADGKKKDVTFNAIVTPGAMASPVIGQNSLGDLVYFTLSSVSATGAKTLGEAAAMEGVIIALDKTNGEVLWHKAMPAYCYSSPVAVYSDTGEGWIIQACSDGTIYLLDGLTGADISTLQVDGVIEGSPAVYGNMMVIGTTGKDSSYIYGIMLD
ncbi:MAG: PQQ-binding-like beta-propeller repeat protein [Clostridiales bacterium]|nr:PQQ-binding-like beta-propeller repeat protein [Clostridiales bacterium]